jgi:hypothetical protein
MKLNQFVVIILSVLVLSVVGCGSYYKIIDPSTSKIYYTDDIKRKGSSVKFKDANTGSTVTLQNTEIKDINKEEFKANTPRK